MPGYSDDLTRSALSDLVGTAAARVDATGRSHLPLERHGRPVGTVFPVRDGSDVVGAVVVVRLVRRGPPSSTATRTVVGLCAEAARVLQRLLVTDDLVRSARVDRLTGLGNRVVVEQALGALRSGDAVVLVDLDHFKTVNDTLGHAAGDAVLAAFGAELRRWGGADRVVTRYGGEEFLAVLPGCGADEAVRHLDELRQRWAGASEGVTFSSGVAVRAPGEDTGETLARADRALYQAKRTGRDRDVVARASVGDDAFLGAARAALP